MYFDDRSENVQKFLCTVAEWSHYTKISNIPSGNASVPYSVSTGHQFEQNHKSAYGIPLAALVCLHLQARVAFYVLSEDLRMCNKLSTVISNVRIRILDCIRKERYKGIEMCILRLTSKN